MQSTKDIFKNLIGRWAIKRILGNYGNADGIAEFTLGVGVEESTSSSTLKLNYREDLEVNYNENFIRGGSPFKQSAYKEYIYIYDEGRDKIIKKFIDGRLFYELNIELSTGDAQGDHLCENDFYAAKYQFLDHSHFSLQYDVKGPEKDYVITTHFTKLPSNS